MSHPNVRTDEQFAVRIPADVERPDRIMFGLTARQVVMFAVAALIGWAVFSVAAGHVPPTVLMFAAMALAGVTIAVVMSERDGLALDRYALAALRHYRSRRRLVNAGPDVPGVPDWVDPQLAARAGPAPAPLRLPAGQISPDGALGLGADGTAAVAAASTVNFALRTPVEQDALVGALARYLNSLSVPTQILVRAQRLDLGATIAALREYAPALPHPALEAAALAHADYLTELAAQRDLLTRQVLLVHRQPRPAGQLRSRRGPAGRGSAVAGSAGAWVTRHSGDASRALAAAGVRVVALDGEALTAVLAAACDPEEGSGPDRLAAPDAVICAATGAAGNGGAAWSA